MRPLRYPPRPPRPPRREGSCEFHERLSSGYLPFHLPWNAWPRTIPPRPHSRSISAVSFQSSSSDALWPGFCQRRAGLECGGFLARLRAAVSLRAASLRDALRGPACGPSRLWEIGPQASAPKSVRGGLASSRSFASRPWLSTRGSALLPVANWFVRCCAERELYAGPSAKGRADEGVGWPPVGR